MEKEEDCPIHIFNKNPQKALNEMQQRISNEALICGLFDPQYEASTQVCPCGNVHIYIKCVGELADA